MAPRSLLLLVSAGGVLGAMARYGVSVGWPCPAGGFPWATWAVNVSGCFLIGMLLGRLPGHERVRAFLGVGFLGGYTTFSTAMVDVARDPSMVGVMYFVGTVLGALLAVWAGSVTGAKRGSGGRRNANA